MTRWFLVAAGWVALAAASGHVRAAGLQRPSAPAASERAVLDRYCVSCHNQRSKIPEGRPLLLDTLDLTDVGAQPEAWEKVVRKLRTGAMPPAGVPRPTPEVADRLAASLEHALDRAAAVAPDPGRVPAVRRLTRTEYRHAVRDLLALDHLPKELDIELLLPADNMVGFDTVAETLFVTPTLMEGYVSAARKISRIAVGDPQLPLIVDTYRLPLELPQDDHVEGLPLGTRGGALIRRYFPLDGEYTFKLELAGTAREPHELEVSIDGQRVGMFTVGGGVRRQPAYDGESDGALQSRVPLRAGLRQIGVAFLKRTSATNEALVRPYTRSRGQLPSIAAVTISGPEVATGAGDSSSRRRLLICRPAAPEDEETCARRVLATLARRAYRRAATDEDVKGLMRFYNEGRADGGFERGVQRALERVLVAPEFLLRVEYPRTGHTASATYSISDVELASRLSFFLWSSIPDDELLDRGDRGAPQHACGRSSSRCGACSPTSALMRSSPTSRPSGSTCAICRPDGRTIGCSPTLTKDCGRRSSAKRSSSSTSILREDRSLLDLLNADYTFVNERLARHYGIPNVYGSHFRRVSLGPNSVRAGLLGQGSILTLTSYSTRTSPVVRGQVDAREHPRGAAAATAAECARAQRSGTEGGKMLSMRERMAAHRANPVCASCHARMDPLGFALENFDAIGRWRDDDESGTPIDASGVLPDGTAFDGTCRAAHRAGSPAPISS